MPTSPYFPSYYGGTTGEQGLVQDLVDEQIKLFGTDIYYLPRTLITDGVLDDVIYNKFESQFQVEMLLQNVEGFGSPSEFISKFGLRITDEVRFVVSQRRWEEAAAGYTLTVPTRPNEGDLLYFPLTQDIYEIKFVEREDPFYQLGKIYFYTMTAEIYEYGSDDISTGVAEIDVLETIMSPAILMFMDPGGIGDFQVGEEVVGDEFLAKATATTAANRTISALTLTDSGSHYSQTLPPTVTISAPDVLAGGASSLSTSEADGTFDTYSGSGYTEGTTYTTTTVLNGGSGMTIRIDDIDANGGVTGFGGVTMTNITIIDAGSGYSTNQTGSGGPMGSVVRVDGGNNDLYFRVEAVYASQQATATATVNSSGLVSAITLTDAGAGYINTPTVTIDYSPKDNRAEVKSWDSATRKLEIINRTGTFTTAETVTGLTSGAKWSPESYDTLNNTNSEYDQNREIEDAADNIIDWTEGNPFGEAGNFTGSI